MHRAIEKTKKVLAYQRSKSIVDNLLRRKVVKLNIGCGTDYKKGWINIDNNSDHNIKKLDPNWDLRYLLPFPDNSVDFIFNEHFMEHLTVEEGIRANRDFIRVLKGGGVLRIATPDLETIVDNYLKVPLDKDKVIKSAHLEFVQTSAEWINMSFSWWGHKWIYDWQELQRRLQEAGFSKMKRYKIKQSKYRELCNLETRAGISLIVEATK